MYTEEHPGDLEHSGKLVLLFSLLEKCKENKEKVLVFSQSLLTLDMIEYFLKVIDQNTKNQKKNAKLAGFTGPWTIGSDYFRLDGNTPHEKRNEDCNSFNLDNNPRAR